MKRRYFYYLFFFSFFPLLCIPLVPCCTKFLDNLDKSPLSVSLPPSPRSLDLELDEDCPLAWAACLSRCSVGICRRLYRGPELTFWLSDASFVLMWSLTPDKKRPLNQLGLGFPVELTELELMLTVSVFALDRSLTTEAFLSLFLVWLTIAGVDVKRFLNIFRGPIGLDAGDINALCDG